MPDNETPNEGQPFDLEALPQQIASLLDEQTSARAAIKADENIAWPQAQARLADLNGQYAARIEALEQQARAALAAQEQASQPQYPAEALEAHWQTIQARLDQTPDLLQVMQAIAELATPAQRAALRQHLPAYMRARSYDSNRPEYHWPQQHLEQHQRALLSLIDSAEARGNPAAFKAAKEQREQRQRILNHLLTYSRAHAKGETEIHGVPTWDGHVITLKEPPAHKPRGTHITSPEGDRWWNRR